MSGGRALIVGATSWGCTLAIQMLRAGTDVTLLCRTPEEAARLSAEREQHVLLPGIVLPDTLRITHDPTAAYDAVIFAVPAQRLRENATRILPQIHGRPLLVSAAKGLEVGTERRMSEVLAEAAGGMDLPSLAVISGPNIAREIASGHQATTVVASEDADAAVRLRDMLMTPNFRVYTNPDVVGVELGGALKNVMALGVGIGDALNAGDNGRAAFLTRGLAEMARLGIALGASPLTFTGLAGLGDLLVTSMSQRSRNRYVGEALGQGRPLAEVLGGMVHVAEGVETTRAARVLALRHQVEMPITEMIHRVLFDALPPADAIYELMTRAPQDELAGMPDLFRGP